jgi:hypothetical protein
MKARAALLLLLRGLAVVAGLTWLVLAFRAGSGRESEAAAQLRTAALIVGFFAAGLGWSTPPKPGGRNKERL